MVEDVPVARLGCDEQHAAAPGSAPSRRAPTAATGARRGRRPRGAEPRRARAPPAIGGGAARRAGALGDRPRGRRGASAGPGTRRGDRHQRQDDRHHAHRGDARRRGRSAVAAGNIGRPLLDAVDDDVDVVVAEVSSFQLRSPTGSRRAGRRCSTSAPIISTGIAPSTHMPRPRRTSSCGRRRTTFSCSTPTTRSSPASRRAPPAARCRSRSRPARRAGHASSRPRPGTSSWPRTETRSPPSTTCPCADRPIWPTCSRRAHSRSMSVPM